MFAHCQSVAKTGTARLGAIRNRFEPSKVAQCRFRAWANSSYPLRVQGCDCKPAGRPLRPERSGTEQNCRKASENPWSNWKRGYGIAVKLPHVGDSEESPACERKGNLRVKRPDPSCWANAPPKVVADPALRAETRDRFAGVSRPGSQTGVANIG